MIPRILHFNEIVVADMWDYQDTWNQNWENHQTYQDHQRFEEYYETIVLNTPEKQIKALRAKIREYRLKRDRDEYELDILMDGDFSENTYSIFYNLKNRIRHIGSAIDHVQVDIAELKDQIRNKGYPTIY